MTTQTKIEWADKTWSPIIGCDRVSPGCDRCYAISIAHIRSSNPNPKIQAAFAGTTERANGRIDWTGRVNLLEHRLAEPLRWRKPARVFVNSQSDLFHKEVPDEFIARVWAVMAATPQHSYQILTKRHARMRALLGGSQGSGLQRLLEAASNDETAQVLYDAPWPLPNVHLGVSVEDQQRAELRIPPLLETPAAVRFLSCEPLLGPVDLTRWLRPVPGCRHVDTDDGTCGHPEAFTPECHRWADCPVRREFSEWHGLDWVIVGGESGPGARPMHPEWARSVRDECAVAGVPFLFKQWGEWAPSSYLVGDPVDDMGHQMEMCRVGKKRAGRELDGRTHDEFPTAVALGGVA